MWVGDLVTSMFGGIRIVMAAWRRALSTCWPCLVAVRIVVVAIAARYKGFRYPKEIISHAVWLYYRFMLSLRDVQELLFERGIVVSHETIRACVRSSDPTTPASCVAAGPAPAIDGTSMKCS